MIHNSSPIYMPPAKTKRPAAKKLTRPVSARALLPVEPAPDAPTPAPARPSWYYEEKTVEPRNVETKSTERIVVAPHNNTWTCRLMALAIFLFPFLAWPWTFSIHEFPKQILLTVYVAAGLIIIFYQSRNSRALTLLPRHPALILALGAGVAALISALRSGMIYQGLLGYGGVEPLSLLGLLLLGLWALIVAHPGKNYLRLPINALIASGSALSLITILSLTNLPLYRFVEARGFNPAGTTTAAGLIAAATIILICGRLQSRAREGVSWFAGVAALLPPVVLLLGAGFRAPLIVCAVGLGVLTLHTVVHRENRRAMLTRALPLMLGLAIAVVFAIRPFTDFLTTPLEISPSHKETASIVRQTLNASPVLGSGPGSFAAQYLRLRSLPILQTPFWSIAFDWGSSALLTFLVNYGLLGAGLFGLAILSLLGSLLYRLHKSEAGPEEFGLFAASIALFVGLGLAPAPFALLFFFATLLGLALAASTRPFNLPYRGVLAMVDRVFVIAAIVILLLVQGVRSASETLAARAHARAGIDLSASMRMLERAARLDPYRDAHRRLLTDVNRAQLQKTVTDPAFTQNREAGLQELREIADRLLNHARRATELAPAVSANWVNLGNAYLELAPLTSGAAEEGAAAFTRAAELSPADPSILVNLGIAKTLSAQGTDETKTRPLTESAEQFFRKAAEIRPNYPFAYLELARLLGRQNKIGDALAAYARAASLAPADAALQYEIGLFLLQNNRTDEARVALTEAVRLAPNFSNARWFLAQIYETAEEYTKAIEQIEKVVEINPENQQAKDRLVELEKKVK